MKRGYRPASNVDEAMGYVFSYLEDNSEECQFSFEDNQIEGETGYKILSDNWYNERRKDLVEERLRILKVAADILVEDIRSHVYDNSVYAPSVDYLRDVESAIPPSLLYFMESVVLKHKKGRLDEWKKKCVALSHSVISAVRPRSFVTSLLTGVGTYLYKKFGSRLLVNVLSSLGFSSSYDMKFLDLSCLLYFIQTHPSRRMHYVNSFSIMLTSTLTH
ncbi:hypothetical protein JTE90_004097 [Oedothorax gibbosus]|uniref:Uncharacterized protein n=1 Tax=Oedothorax gibbosus TaxID=931172 RepID=A0AAV6UE38_9ARAC|nr:hypothetical protein JTE90_004097 [Oedothorax gibbosus]